MNSLREIIFGTKRKRCLVDGTMIGGIVFPLIKLNSYDVYIYGGGIDISSVILYCWNCGIEIAGIMDMDKNKAGKLVLGKVPIIFPDDMKKCNDEKTIAIINTFYFSGLEQQEIIQTLHRVGITKFYALSTHEREQIKAQSHEWIERGRIDFYREHIEQLEKTYNELYDDMSRDVMTEFIRTHMQCDAYNLEECDGNVKYFYGEKLESNMKNYIPI